MKRVLASAACGLLAALSVVAFPVASVFGPLSAGPERDRARIAAVTRPTQDFSRPERFERRPGGAATVFKKLNH